ncbi:hypothetical protein KY290_010777 [Solanum tuberosum]|uniref:Uncharacterized protein n=1 Tax=Solanum tuberosum TaxID=4113 RepID=A0ABQ7W0S6_SOLTU|nr:hypothetical protein KY290_010777 [Solanum tuberosum]
MVNAQELEAQRKRLGLEVETAARGAPQNAVNNPPKVVDEHLGVEEIGPPYRQPLAPRGQAQHLAHVMYEEDDLDLDRAGATGVIVLPVLPPGVKFTITSTMIKLLNLKGISRGAAGDDVNQHLMNFVAICKSREIPGLIDEVAKKNRAWHTKDAEVEDLGVTFGLSDEQRRRDEERD